MDGSPPPARPCGPPPAQERRDWLRLIRSQRVGPVSFWRLLAAHGSAAAALDALPGMARAAGLGAYHPCPPDQAEREIEAARAAGARALFLGEPGYPVALADLPDAPPLLWSLGDPALAARPMVALIGARNASSLGLRMAARLAEGLAGAGVCVVSGLARGIDAAAHAAALATGGGTIGVQAGGIDVIYPAETAPLHADLAQRGLRLSEQPMGLAPLARHFPQRNRIVSGLCSAVVVVEAAARSGSLLTARNALDQGREVLAIPGHPMDGRAAGCNMLIRDGAVLVRGAEDVLAHLGLPPGPAAAASGLSAPATALATAPAARTGRAPGPAGSRDVGASDAGAGDMGGRAPAPADLAAAVLARLGPSPVPEDMVLRDLGLGAAALAPTLLALELDGQLRRHAGGLISRA